MTGTECRVWRMYQARCLLCGWAEEVTGDPAAAAYGARDHRAGEEHKENLRERREARQTLDKRRPSRLTPARRERKCSQDEGRF